MPGEIVFVGHLCGYVETSRIVSICEVFYPELCEQVSVLMRLLSAVPMADSKEL